MIPDIETLRLGQMGTNCYLVWDRNLKEGLVIDPGDEGDYVCQKVMELGFEPKGLVLTHGHFDHCLGLLELKLSFSTPVYLNHLDLRLYRSVRQSAKHWLGADPGPTPPIDKYLDSNQILTFGRFRLKVVTVPGHTKGSVALTDEKNIVFSGDTLFQAGTGRTDFDYSNPEALKKSLKRLFLLPPDCVVYPGHGEPTTIKAEIINNSNTWGLF